MMRSKLLCVAAVALVLAGCGSSDPALQFETKGLRPPQNLCAADPRSVANAVKINDIDGPSSCGVANAWSVSAVAQVQMSQPATVNCGVIGPLDSWFGNAVQPAASAAFGERVVAVDVAASYACRPRNNRRGAKMSEHGFGNAIDLAAFTLESGRKISVKTGWNGSSGERQFLRQIRAGACSDFTTVLGPGSDRYHNDHLHLDLAQHGRSGVNRYCH